MSETRELTLTDKKKLEADLADLMEAKKRVAEEIQIARGFGDLSENAEYDAAKAKEAEVYGNINRIEQILRTATFVDDSAASTDVVSLGNVVRVLDMEYDEEDEYTIVGFTEADPLKLVISIRRVSISKCAPVGYCIQPLAFNIHNAERFEPNATSHVTSRCWYLFSRCQPKKNSPTKVDSRKKAINASIASGAPKISPT